MKLAISILLVIGLAALFSHPEQLIVDAKPKFTAAVTDALHVDVGEAHAEASYILPPTPEPSLDTASTEMREDWLIEVGIAQSDWPYVDCVINGCEGYDAEGGWDGVQKWNWAGSGAYGICQSLPAEKMASAGDDWQTNGVTQLRWCHEYAINRYGSWSAAWEFRKCVGECYNPHQDTITFKDHTWW